LTLSGEDEDPVVDISHESLIRLWDRLGQWVKEEADSAAIYIRLAGSAGRKLALYRDPELSEAVRWRQTALPNVAWAERYTPQDAAALPRAIAFLRRSEVSRLIVRTRNIGVFVAICAVSLVAVWFSIEARRQRGAAESARNNAEQLVQFMLFDLRDKLRPIGRLDLLDGVNQRVNEYYKSMGSGNSPDYQHRWSVAQENYGDGARGAWQIGGGATGV
jgi:hypothetical protein